MTAHLLLAPDYVFSLSAALLILVLLLGFFVGEFVCTTIVPIRRQSYHRIETLEAHSHNRRFKHRLHMSILFIGTVSVLGSLAYLWIFISHFGSLFGLLSAGWLIREEMGSGAISVPLTVRAFALLSYSGVSLALVYWIRYGLRPFLALPFLSVLIMGTAQAARAGTFMVLISIVVGSYWRDRSTAKIGIGQRFIKRAIYFFLVILVIFIIGLMYREQSSSLDIDHLQQLLTFRSYSVGALSAFSVFLDQHNFASDLTWGRYSFASFFELVGLHKFTSFGYYDEYLPISTSTNDYTNVYTIFRSLIEDFGILGALFFMLSVGAGTRLAYAKAINGGPGALAFVCGMYAMFVYSPIAPMTQHNSIVVSWIFPPFILWLMQSRRLSVHRRGLEIDESTRRTAV